MVPESSTAGTTTVKGKCPHMGASVIHWQPRDVPMTVGKWADVEAAQQKHETLPDNPDEYLGEQYCYRAVAAKDAES